MSRDLMLNVMRAYHAPETRRDYLNFIYLGNPPVDEAGDLPAELEAELPERFQRGETVTHEEVAAAEENQRREVAAFIATLEHDVTKCE